MLGNNDHYKGSLGAIELGGTKIICGISHATSSFRSASDFAATERIETTTPEESFAEIIRFFKTSELECGPLCSIGVACFGPLDINPASLRYGQILDTTKPGWSGYPVRKRLAEAFAVPVTITTDVNAALLAESELGAAQGVTNGIYITIGTGVGAGIMVNGELVSGFLHPEVGHMRVPTNRVVNNDVVGNCAFHRDCVEGLVSGPAIALRAGMPAEDLPRDSSLWEDIANTIADMCINLTMTLATQKIILGGGVMAQPDLLGKVQTRFKERLAGYLNIDQLAGGVERLICRPALQNNSGLIGALLLAQRALAEQ